MKDTGSTFVDRTAGHGKTKKNIAQADTIPLHCLVKSGGGAVRYQAALDIESYNPVCTWVWV